MTPAPEPDQSDPVSPPRTRPPRERRVEAGTSPGRNGSAPDWLIELRDSAGDAPPQPEPDEPVWAEGFTPLSIKAPTDDEHLPTWIEDLRDESDETRPQAALESAPADAAEAPPTRPSAWVSRLRGGTTSPEPDVPEAVVTAPVADPPVVPATGWTTRLRRGVGQRAAAGPSELPEPLESQTGPGPMLAIEHVVSQARPTAPTEPAVPDEAMPVVYAFSPRRTMSIVASAVLVAGVLVTVYLAWQAYRSPDQPSIAIAAVAAFATAVVWAVRVTTTVTRLTVRDGKLEVVRDRVVTVFDLVYGQPPVELVGTPGTRGWKALFVRRGLPPLEITSAIVDPVEFTRVVHSYRPADPTSSAGGAGDPQTAIQ